MFKLVWAGTVPWILNLLRMTKAGEGHGSHWSRQGARTWLGGAIFQEAWDHGVTWWLRWEKDGRDPKGTLEEHLLFRKGWEGFRSKLLIRVDRLSVWIQIGSSVFIFSRIFFLFLEPYFVRHWKRRERKLPARVTSVTKRWVIGRGGPCTMPAQWRTGKQVEYMSFGYLLPFAYVFTRLLRRVSTTP